MQSNSWIRSALFLLLAFGLSMQVGATERGGPGTCIDGSYCDDLACYAPNSAISQLFCGCRVLNPECGLGTCVGNSYCEPSTCGNPQCFLPNSFLSLALCSGIPLDENCELTSVPGCTAPPPEMHVWWTFDETTGSVATDIMGANDGVHVNGPLPWPGQVAGALLFDGIDDHVKARRVGPHSHHNLTIDAWIKLDKIGEDLHQPIVRYARNTYGLDVIGDELMFFNQIDPSSYAYPTTNANLQPQVWTHVAVTADANQGEVHFFINGNIVQTYNTYVAYGTHPNSGGDWLVGTAPPSTFFDGMIDEVEIFERPLGSGEIRNIYEAGSAGKCKPE